MIGARNAQFQQWQALLTNRTKRSRMGQFLVHGVRPITMAVRHGYEVQTLIFDGTRPLSRWAAELVADAAPAVAMAPQLLRELGDKADETPELVAVVAMPPDDLGRITVDAQSIVVLLDRPTNPGNIGTLIRSADAFDAAGVVVTGHAADPYDPKAVRASTGSLFAVPTVRAPSHREVIPWVAGAGLSIVGTDERGPVAIDEHDLTGPTLLLVGNETSGLSAAWLAACDTVVRIPIGGSASSLNAAAAGTVALYEAARQRRRPTRRL